MLAFQAHRSPSPVNRGEQSSPTSPGGRSRLINSETAQYYGSSSPSLVNGSGGHSPTTTTTTTTATSSITINPTTTTTTSTKNVNDDWETNQSSPREGEQTSLLGSQVPPYNGTYDWDTDDVEAQTSDDDYMSDDEDKGDPDGSFFGTYRPPGWKWIHIAFGSDYRSIAAFRVGLALLTLTDLYARAQFMDTFYTDYGVLSTAAVGRHYTSIHWCFHCWSGSALWAWIVFGMHFVGALFMLVGYYSRLSTAFCWWILCSLHNRNPMVLQGGDTLFRVCFFWAMFLPVGDRWSVDRALSRRHTMRPRKLRRWDNIVCTMATAGILMQDQIMYFCTGILKSDPVWDVTFGAVHDTLGLTQFTTPLGDLLREYPDICYYLTMATIYMERYCWIFAFMPWKPGFFKTFAWVSYAGFHIGTAATMELGLFPYTSCIVALPILPTAFWDVVLNWISTAQRKSLKVYYLASDANTANLARILGTMVLHRDSTVTPCQRGGRRVAASLVEHNTCWAVCTRASGNTPNLFGAEAVYYAICTSPFLPFMQWAPLYNAGVSLIRYAKRNNYAASAANTSNALTTVCKTTPPGTWIIAGFNKAVEVAKLAYIGADIIFTNASGLRRARERKVFRGLMAGYIALVMCIYIFLWNVRTLEGYEWVLPKELNGIAVILRMEQSWKMFAPRPLTEDGWYILATTLMDSPQYGEFDLHPGRRPLRMPGDPIEASKTRPEEGSTIYPSQRWRKYMMNLRRETNGHHWPYFMEYLSRDFARRNPEYPAISMIRFSYMRDNIRRRDTGGKIIPLHLYTWHWNQEQLDREKKEAEAEAARKEAAQKEAAEAKELPYNPPASHDQ